MKKLLTLILLAISLTGCGATTVQENATADKEKNSTIEVTEEEKDEKTKEESEEQEETTAVQKQYSSDELEKIVLVITYNSDASTENMWFEYCENSYDYYSSDLTGNGGKICGVHETMYGKNTYGLEFTGEIAEKTDSIFDNLYKTSIEPYRDVIDDTFMELAQKCADEKINPAISGLDTVNITDRMSDRLVMEIDGSTIELNVVNIEIRGIRCAKDETEPENNTVPCWVDDDGKYEYLEHIKVTFSVPKDQLSLLYAFYNTAEKEQQMLVDSGLVETEESANSAAETEQASEKVSQTTADIDLAGVWYDPTGYISVIYTFNGDGTGTINWGYSTQEQDLTYSLSGNTLTVILPNNVDVTMTVGLNCLYYAGDKLVKK